VLSSIFFLTEGEFHIGTNRTGHRLTMNSINGQPDGKERPEWFGWTLLVTEPEFSMQKFRKLLNEVGIKDP